MRCPVQNVCQSAASFALVAAAVLAPLVKRGVAAGFANLAVAAACGFRCGSFRAVFAGDADTRLTSILKKATAARRLCACCAIDCAAAEASSTNAAFYWVTWSIWLTA